MSPFYAVPDVTVHSSQRGRRPDELWQQQGDAYRQSASMSAPSEGREGHRACSPPSSLSHQPKDCPDTRSDDATDAAGAADEVIE